ncbi:MAG: hotdog fold domain-containing protein [Bacteroidota bacterium]
MNWLLQLQSRFEKWPKGNRMFSYMAARNAPYFLTIKPKIIELRHNYMEAEIKKRRKVENHLKTVHAIAMCNLCEFTAGICMEASIPSHRRWIPMGMQVAYLKKAKTDLKASCDLSEVDWDTCTVVDCFVSVRDTDNVEVMTANIQMKVSDKKK